MFRGSSPRRLNAPLHGSVLALLLCLAATQCSRSPTAPSPTGSSPTVPNTPTTPRPTPTVSEVFAGAGDIALCPAGATTSPDAEATATLLESIGGTVFTLGDNAYPAGTTSDFNCYDHSWGRLKGRTMPAPGNHDYHDYRAPGADGYFRYFGSAAGPSGRGYYSYDLGAWHIISLNSNSDDASVQVNAASAQAAWLRQDLADHPSKCTLAYWHHPLFSSGVNGDSLRMRDLYRILYEAGADVVLSGHDHLYERFAPQDPDGRSDPTRGIAAFVVGTGGVPLYDFRVRKPNSVVQIKDHGVLKLTLNPESYSFEFIAVGGGVRDFGANTACH